MQKVKKYSKRILSVILALVLTLAYVPLLDFETEAAATSYKWRVTVYMTKGSKNTDSGNVTIYWKTANGTSSEGSAQIYSGSGSGAIWQNDGQTTTYVSDSSLSGTVVSGIVPANAFPYKATATIDLGSAFSSSIQWQVKIEVLDQNGNVLTDSDFCDREDHTIGWTDGKAYTATDEIANSYYPHVTAMTTDTSDVYIPESGSISQNLTLTATDQYGVEWVNTPTLQVWYASLSSSVTKTPTVTYSDVLAGGDQTSTIAATYTSANTSYSSATMYAERKVYISRNMTFDNLFDYGTYRRAFLTTTNASAGSVNDITATGFTIKCNLAYAEAVTQFGAQFGVTGGATYGVTADITKSSGAISEIYFDWFDSSNAHISHSNVRDKASGTVTAPANATSAKIRFDCDIPVGSEGTVRYENVRVYQVDGVQENITVPTPGIIVAYNKLFKDYKASVPTRTAYDFTGWFVNVGGTEYQSFDSSGTWMMQGFEELGINGYMTTFYNTPFYSKWTPHVYTITFVDANGNTFATDTYTIEDTSITLPSTNPTKTAYTFAGWVVDTASGNWTSGTSVTSAVSSKYGDITVKPKWTANNYEINFNSNGGSEVNTINYTYETNLTLPTSTKTGYTFNGWKVIAAWGGTTEAETAVIESMIGQTFAPDFSGSGNYGCYSVEAVWEPTSYNIVYDANGGSCSESTKAYTIESTVTLPTPTRTGYTFAGWKVVNTDGNWSGTNLTGNVSSKYGAVNLQAQWTPIPYAITFYDWDGKVLQQSDVNYDSTPTPPADPTRAADNGYTYAFKGWDPTVVSVTGAATYTATYNATLIPYTITLDAGEGSVTTTTIDYNWETTSVTLPDATRTGYTFTGWTVKTAAGSWSAGATVDGTLSNAYGNVTLVANYTPKQYTVTYDANGGTIEDGYDSTFTATYDSEIGALLSDSEVSRTGYTFTGWKTSDGTEIKAGDIWKYTENVTVYAQWTAIEYRIDFLTFDTTNNKVGFVDAPASITYTIEDDLKTLLPDATVEGYNFNHWLAESTSGSWIGDNTYATADLEAGNWGTVTLVMFYTAKSYTITWVNYDSTVLETDTAYYGSTPKYNGATPEHTPTAQYSYTFAGWSPAVTTVTGDQTYTATYNETEREYTIKFVDWNDTVISEQSLKYGETPVTPADPTREQDAQYTYTFVNWKDGKGGTFDTVPNVTADVAYTADYIATLRSYTITWIVDGKTTTTTVAYGETPKYDGTPSKDATDEYTYTFEGWSPSIADVTGEATYTAQFSSTKNTYTVKFVDEDGTTVLDTQVLEYGVMPEYKGETPTKAADVQYTYTFDKWTPAIDTVTGNVTYTATYSSTVNEYTITFADEDGTTLGTQTVKYGDTPEYDGDEPTKAATAQYTYTFAGWSPAIAEVTGDATYTATYDATVNKYTITFVDEDGTELQSSEVEYGTKPTAPADPTKTGDEQYSYEFAGWTPEIVDVTDDATYKATYTQSVNKYTITFVNDDGTELQSNEVEYGTVPTAPANPTKAADAQYTYTFAGWDKTVVAVTGAVTYKATYTSTVNTYNVTFKDYDGRVIETQTLEYGATPVAPADPSRDATAEWTYTFSGWTPDIEDVTGDATYTAQYTASKNSYKITWIVNGVETTATVAYGETPTFTGSTDKAADAQYTYTFAGWSPAVTSVTGEATYTATYTETVNKYTVTFYDEDGTVLQSSEVAYGETPVYTGETPTKESSGGVDYAFSGWSVNTGDEDVIVLPAVTGDASYYAVYVGTNKEFNVTWYNEDGTVGGTAVVKYGTLASELGLTAADDRASTAQYDFTFVGWNVVDNSETALDLTTYKITADTSFYPAYSKTVREYTITFVDEDGTELETKAWKYGATPAYTGTPTKKATAQYSYTFAGWTPEVVAVTGDATYTATYTATVNKYTITFLNDDDSVLKSVTLEYGATPEAPTATKAATAQYTYTFAGWDKPVVAVTGDATYKATYTSTVNKYTVKFVDEDGTELQSSEIAYGETPVYTGTTPTKTGDAQYSYTFKDWSPAISSVTGVATYTATYTQTVNKYTIKFVNEDGTELQSTEVAYGETPVYEGVTPTKAATAQYTYTFSDWDAEIVAVTGEATYTATYDSTVNKYTIKFVNEDGTELQSSEVAYGETPVYTGETPTKAADVQYTYTFKDWGTIVAVTGEATYTATYDSTVNKYTIKFVNENGDVLQSSEVAYGDTPVYEGVTPTKAATAQYTYTFATWDNEIVAVTGEATYTATYDSTVNKYTITFENEDGTVLQSSEVAYGDTPVYTGETPEKAATAQYTYTHSGWTPAIETVTGDAIYTATYDATVNEYTITWVTGAGTFEGTWEYGSTPDPVADGVDTSKASTVSTAYTFANWDVEIAEVTGDATYTAQYTETTRKYTITWIVDGTETTEDVEYGTVPTAPAAPSKDSTVKYEYTFTGWDNEIVAVDGDATYTAEFAEAIRKYTITWVTGSGEYTSSWEYGSTPDPEVDNVDTSKAPTAEASYTFSGWDKTISVVTGATTYTAQYDAEIRSYTVTYIVDGEIFAVETVKFGSNFSHPVIPEKEGHSSYWDVSYMTMPAQDIAVSAVYTAKKYTVTWIADGKTVATEDVAYGSLITSQPVPAKVGHDGVWDNIPATMPAENVTITAVYTPAEYTVVWTFSTSSGTDIATYGETWAVVFINYVPGDVRITVNGLVLSSENYSYDADSGYLQINPDAITGNITITEKAAEGYQNVTISAVNATVTNMVSIVKEGTTFHTQIVPNEGYLLPTSVIVCIDGIELHSGYTYDLTTGRLTVNGDVIFGELSIRFESPVDPEYGGITEDSHRCTCNCHSTNVFVKFFFSIGTFFRKLFGMNQYRYCDCGNAHW